MESSYIRIRKEIFSWYKKNGRNFPWRINDVSPFNILIAEIFLKQTRANVVSKVYNKFIDKFPDMDAVNNANIKELEILMNPLGILSRAEQIKDIVMIIKKDYNGIMPNNKDKLLEFPGVGEYISSAIRIFSYKEKDVIVDTNIKRIINRIFKPLNKKEMEGILKTMSKDVDSSSFFYSLLDFAALICKARNPLHSICPINSICKEITCKCLTN